MQVNGEKRAVEEDCSLLDLILALGLKAEVTVAERNGKIVPAAAYGETVLGDGDEIELVRIVGGG